MKIAGMVKLVATQVLGTCGEIRGGSSPSTRTKDRKRQGSGVTVSRHTHS